MNIKKLNRKGFSHVEMAIVVLVVAALGFVGYRVLKNTSHAGSKIFNNPTLITADNLGHVWVVNGNGANSVTELNAKDGSLVKVIKGASYGFNHPDAITADNLGHVWVTNYNANSVTELNAKDGSLVQVVE